MRYDSFAPEYEDIIIHAILGEISSGFYIDVGANDPLSGSVTKFFYDRGWQGINVEPLRSGCMLFEEQRPRDINLCVGVSNAKEASRGSMPFYPLGGCSTFDEGVANEPNFTKGKAHMKSVMTLRRIYETYGKGRTVSFCKIDVEGYERKVLEGIEDWEAFRPWIFCMEATKPQTLIPCHEEWEPILLEHGYVFAYHFGVNRYYVDARKDHFVARAAAVDAFFEKNEVTRVRVYSRPRKRLKEQLAVMGLGEEFEENKDRIMERSHVIACYDDSGSAVSENLPQRVASFEEFCNSKVDKFLICAKTGFDEMKCKLLAAGVSPGQIVDIEYLRFDRL